MSLIRLQNVYKTYHLGEVDVPVLRGVTLVIERGEMVALMGASGSGKTTLMNILGCLDRPSSGEYWFDGQELSRLGPNERALVRSEKLGFVFQSFNLLPRTSAVQNMLMPLDYAIRRVPRGEAQRWGLELLAHVGLADRVDHEPSQLSGGQQQRVAIGRSLVNRPAVVLADEPTGNLDSHTSEEILRMFQRLNAEGITVILVTHDPRVASFAHRTIYIRDGVIEGDETITEVEGHAPHAHFSTATNDGSSNGAEGEPANLPNGHQAGDESVLGPRPLVAAMIGAAVGGESVAMTVAASGPHAALPVLAEPEPAATPHWAMPALLPATWRTALRALRRNKMRSALTSLGIIIGVAAVIAMMEIGGGSKSAIQKQIAGLGANNLMIQSGAAASGGITWGLGSVMTLTPEDCDEIIRQCGAVQTAYPLVRGRGQAIYGGLNWSPSNIAGTTPAYLVVREWKEFTEGEMFTDRDVRNVAKVCVIGHTIRRKLFPYESAVGKDLRIQNVMFRVVGVLGRKGGGMGGQDQDDIILAPWTTIKYRLTGSSSGSGGSSQSASGSSSQSQGSSSGGSSNGSNTMGNIYPGGQSPYPPAATSQNANTPQGRRFSSIDMIMAKAKSAEEIPEAMDQITALLRQHHRMGPDKPDDFNIRDMTEFSSAMLSVSRQLTTLLVTVALISLVVGGVGIMNIMLVSVTERTREIGLRMAVGARAHHILRQFLVEAVVLCLFGGITGILLGRGASLLVRWLFGYPIQVSVPAILAAVGVAATVGLVFGFYPAWKASRLDPIEALRYE